MRVILNSEHHAEQAAAQKCKDERYNQELALLPDNTAAQVMAKILKNIVFHKHDPSENIRLASGIVAKQCHHQQHENVRQYGQAHVELITGNEKIGRLPVSHSQKLEHGIGKHI